MISCSLCDFQAFSKGNLTFHLNSVHFKDKEFICRLCHFKTAYKGALTRHVNSVHLRTGKTKECPICGYITSSLLNLNSHLSVSHHLEIATAFARPSGHVVVREEDVSQADASPPRQQQPPFANSNSPNRRDPEPHRRPERPSEPRQIYPDPKQHTPPTTTSVSNSAHISELKAREDLFQRYNFAHLNILYRELNNHHARTSAVELEERLARSSAVELEERLGRGSAGSIRVVPPLRNGGLDYRRSRESLGESQRALLMSSNVRSPTTPPPSPPPLTRHAPAVSASSSSHLKSHPSPLLLHHPYINSMQCRLCHFQAGSPAYLRNHLRTVHLDEVHTMCCPVCEYTSDRRSDIENHMDLEHVKALPARAGRAVINLE